MSDERSTSAFDRQLGHKVRARRLELGMSQETLAARLGVTFQQVQKYEKGVNRVAASRLLKIADALELPVATFFESARTKTTSDKTGAVLATREGAELVSLFADIKDRRVRAKAVAMMRALARN